MSNLYSRFRTLLGYNIPESRLSVTGTFNEHGGIPHSSDFDLVRSRDHDLKTLPPAIEGAHCLNCMHVFRDSYDFRCKNNRMYGIKVNDRMICRLWDNVETIRSWIKD